MPKEKFTKKLNRALSSGYFIVFAVIIGGPIFIFAPAITAALGYNIYLIFLLSLLGEMTVDILFYFIGYYSRAGIVEKYGLYFRLTRRIIAKLEVLLLKHPWKSLLIIKYSPFPIPGIVLTGALKLEFNKFFYILFSLSIPKTFFFTVVAYFFGQAYNAYLKYYDYGQYLLLSAAVLFVLVNYLLNLFSKKVIKNE